MSRLSEQGRLRCSEAGHRNVARALEVRLTAPIALRQASAAFEADLAAELGEAPTASQRALLLSATASFSALYIVREKLLAARRFRRIETLIGQLTPLQGSLQRTLRALGVDMHGAGDGTEPDAPSVESLQAEYAARAAEREEGSS